MHPPTVTSAGTRPVADNVTSTFAVNRRCRMPIGNVLPTASPGHRDANRDSTASQDRAVHATDTGHGRHRRPRAQDHHRRRDHRDHGDRRQRCGEPPLIPARDHRRTCLGWHTRDAGRHAARPQGHRAARATRHRPAAAGLRTSNVAVTTTGAAGACVITGPAGDMWLVYHAWTPDRIGYPAGGARSLHFAALRWDVYGLAVATTAAHPASV
jgi:hypothetical protein